MEKHFKYKGVTVNAFGLPVSSEKKKDYQPISNKRRYYQHRTFNFPFSLSAPRDMIVIYDFPASKRKERDWFRRHLKMMDYVMIQKSVWIGPSPLPKDLLDYVRSIGLFDQLKIFKLAEPYVNKNK